MRLNSWRKSRFIYTLMASNFCQATKKITSVIVVVILLIGFVILVTHKHQRKKYFYQGQGLIRHLEDDTLNIAEWKPLMVHSSHMSNVFHTHHNTKQYLREKVDNLTAATQPKDGAKNICKYYYEDVFIVKYVMPNFYGQCRGSSGSRTQISLLLQMEASTAYLGKLKQISENWRSPISVVFYFQNTGDNIDSSVDDFRTRVAGIFKEFLLEGSSICTHIVVTKENPSYFPINTLRNIATRFAPTDLVLMSEADFIPEAGLDLIINKYIHMDSMKKMAFVIPVFGTLLNNIPLPGNKEELLTYWKQNKTVPIHVLKDITSGHIQTDYKQYRLTDKSYEVKYTPQYEPYYVINRRYVPSYPEIFQFGFMDKSIHAFLLNNTGYKFVVLPDTFMVHTPHRKVYHRDYRTVRCAEELYKDLTEELKKPRKTRQD